MPESETSRRFLGITVMADFILYEGIDRVLDNLVEKAGATAVALNPTVTCLSEKGMGSFQPPSDAGSSPRLFDRPLWGKRSFWVKSAPSYHPISSYYEATPYKCREANDLTDSHGAIVEKFIDAALDRGLKVYLQLGAAQPPALKEDDIPRLPDGRIPEARMANTGSLASEAVRSYNRAYLRDLLNRYPQVTGFRPDWPEYPCYKLDEAFQDFSPHVRKWAESHGFDFLHIQEEVMLFYNHLRGSLENADLEDFASADRGKLSQVSLLLQYPGILDWLRLKAALSVDTLREWREVITEYGGNEKELSANAFMPPFSLITGFDFTHAADYCAAVSPKLYTMHWSVMVEFWGSILLAQNPELDEALVVKALANLFDLGDEISANRIEDYGYPNPDEDHPIPNEPQVRKIKQVLSEVSGRAEVTPIIHGYGPLEDFTRRFQLVADSQVDGAWVNRYGYLSDEKLDAINKIWR